MDEDDDVDPTGEDEGDELPPATVAENDGEGEDDDARSASVPSRPDGPGPSPGLERGRLLRALAACNEEVLQACPEERFKFSGLGAVILGTSLMAAISMTLGLSILLQRHFLLVLPIGLLWGGFVLALDRWLVAAGHGLRHFLPRIVLATFFGFIVAEPIVLLAFDDAVMADIAEDTRSGTTDELERLNTCNPEIDDPLQPPSPPAGCEDSQLPIERPVAPVIPVVPAELVQEQSRLHTKQAELQDLLTAHRNGLQLEFEGTAGADLTGMPGDGPAAAARRENVEGVEADLALVNEQVTNIDKSVAEATAAKDTAEQNARDAVAAYNTEVRSAIDTAVDEREEKLSETPQLARRMDKLTELMFDSPTIFGARIALTLFFVAVDISPALIRMTSTGSAYDRILDLRLERAVGQARGERDSETRERNSALRIRDAHVQHRTDMVEHRLALRRRLALARLSAKLDREVARQESDELRLAAERRNGVQRKSAPST